MRKKIVKNLKIKKISKCIIDSKHLLLEIFKHFEYVSNQIKTGTIRFELISKFEILIDKYF